METSLGSPRSSSGYGSSEEDHQGLATSSRRRRANFAQIGGGTIPIPASFGGGSTGSSPQTPQSLSPSETGSSRSSPSPFSIDFRSVFDDADLAGAMPDFSDLEAFASTDCSLDDVELPVDLWPPGELESWADELDCVAGSLDVAQTTTNPAAQVDDVGPTSKRADKRLLRDDSHILISLLKRPKAELDWIATGVTPPPTAVGQFLNSTTCAGEQCVVSTQTNVNAAVSQVASASPLQRLRALTNSDIVNHVASQTSSLSGTNPAVITTAVPLASAIPVRVVSQPASSPFHDARKTLIVRRQSSSPTSSVSSQTSNSSCGISKRRPSAQKLVSLSRPASFDRHKSLPAAAAAVRTVAPPVAVRSVRSELDDHRYSTPLPPTSAERPCHPRSSSVAAAKPSRPGRSSVDSRCPSRRPSVTVTSRSLSSSAPAASSSSVLEMLLRTSKRLKPNAGSDAVMATCRGGGAPAKRSVPSRRRVVHQPANRTQSSRPKFATSPDALLADLTGASAQKSDVHEPPAVAASSAVVQTPGAPSCGELSSPVSVECFTLFSEHLLSDSQGVIDVGLMSDDQLAWTPSRLDDKVISNELEEVMREQVRQDDTWLQQYLSELL